MRLKRLPVVLALMLILIVSISGCSLKKDNPATPPTPNQQQSAAPQTPAPAPKTDVAVYYLKITEKDAYLVREIHPVDPTPSVMVAALNELIKGTPVTPGAVRVMPPDTKVLGIKVEQGLATVDFSAEVLTANAGSSGEALGIASIVNTLTEFPDIKKVSFLVEGKLDSRAKDWWGHVGLYNQPFKRNLSVVREPAIWVTSPASGQVITSPVSVRGSAQAFEGRVAARIKDSAGKSIAQGYTTTTQGMGRGDFEFKLTFKPAGPGKGQIEVYTNSPKDGREQNLVTVPVEWR